MTTIEALLNRQAVARALNCSVKKVDEATRSGELRSVKLGRLRRYRPEDVAAYVKGLQDAQAQAKEALISWSRRKLAS